MQEPKHQSSRSSDSSNNSGMCSGIFNSIMFSIALCSISNICHSICGVSYIAEKFDGDDVESSQRRKARLERQKRTVERAVSSAPFLIIKKDT